MAGMTENGKNIDLPAPAPLTDYFTSAEVLR